MSDDRQRLIPGPSAGAPPAYSPYGQGAMGPAGAVPPPAGAVPPPAGAVPPPAGAVPPGGVKTHQPTSGQHGGQYGSYAGPPGYQPATQPSYLQQQPQSVTVIHQQPSVVVVGGCPACRIGVLEDDFTCLGVLCAILFFPLGLVCCLLMRQRRCPNCGAVFG